MFVINDKYLGVLLGCALGDTLGMPVEGWKRAQIQKYIGRITEPIAPVIHFDTAGKRIEEDEFGKFGYYTADLTLGEYTDDTILTLKLAKSLVRCKEMNLGDVAKRQVEAYTELLQPDGHVRGGFGTTTEV